MARRAAQEAAKRAAPGFRQQARRRLRRLTHALLARDAGEGEMTLSTRQVDEIRALGEAGKTARQIADATGRRESGVIYLCHRYGIPLRTKTGRTIGKTKWTAQRRATFEAMKADPEKWARYTRKLARSCTKGGDAGPRPCAAGAWERALRGRRFADAIAFDAGHGRVGRVVLEQGVGRSSMAYG